MKRRDEVRARLTDFARRIALRDLNKLDEEIEDDAGWGIWVDEELIYTCFLDYHDHGLLPDAGGTRDQDPHVMKSFSLMRHMVSWYIENEKKPNPDDLPEL